MTTISSSVLPGLIFLDYCESTKCEPVCETSLFDCFNPIKTDTFQFLLLKEMSKFNEAIPEHCHTIKSDMIMKKHDQTSACDISLHKKENPSNCVPSVDNQNSDQESASNFFSRDPMVEFKMSSDNESCCDQISEENVHSNAGNCSKLTNRRKSSSRSCFNNNLYATQLNMYMNNQTEMNLFKTFENLPPKKLWTSPLKIPQGSDEHDFLGFENSSISIKKTSKKLMLIRRAKNRKSKPIQKSFSGLLTDRPIRKIKRKRHFDDDFLDDSYSSDENLSPPVKMRNISEINDAFERAVCSFDFENSDGNLKTRQSTKNLVSQISGQCDILYNTPASSINSLKSTKLHEIIRKQALLEKKIRGMHFSTRKKSPLLNNFLPKVLLKKLSSADVSHTFALSHHISIKSAAQIYLQLQAYTNRLVPKNCNSTVKYFPLNYSKINAVEIYQSSEQVKMVRLPENLNERDILGSSDLMSCNLYSNYEDQLSSEDDQYLQEDLSSVPKPVECISLLECQQLKDVSPIQNRQLNFSSQFNILLPHIDLPDSLQNHLPQLLKSDIVSKIKLNISKNTKLFQKPGHKSKHKLHKAQNVLPDTRCDSPNPSRCVNSLPFTKTCAERETWDSLPSQFSKPHCKKPYSRYNNDSTICRDASETMEILKSDCGSYKSSKTHENFIPIELCKLASNSIPPNTFSRELLPKLLESINIDFSLQSTCNSVTANKSTETNHANSYTKTCSGIELNITDKFSDVDRVPTTELSIVLQDTRTIDEASFLNDPDISEAPFSPSTHGVIEMMAQTKILEDSSNSLLYQATQIGSETLSYPAAYQYTATMNGHTGRVNSCPSPIPKIIPTATTEVKFAVSEVAEMPSLRSLAASDFAALVTAPDGISETSAVGKPHSTGFISFGKQPAAMSVTVDENTEIPSDETTDAQLAAMSGASNELALLSGEICNPFAKSLSAFTESCSVNTSRVTSTPVAVCIASTSVAECKPILSTSVAMCKLSPGTPSVAKCQSFPATSTLVPICESFPSTSVAECKSFPSTLVAMYDSFPATLMSVAICKSSPVASTVATSKSSPIASTVAMSKSSPVISPIISKSSPVTSPIISKSFSSVSMCEIFSTVVPTSNSSSVILNPDAFGNSHATSLNEEKIKVCSSKCDDHEVVTLDSENETPDDEDDFQVISENIKQRKHPAVRLTLLVPQILGGKSIEEITKHYSIFQKGDGKEQQISLRNLLQNCDNLGTVQLVRKSPVSTISVADDNEIMCLSENAPKTSMVNDNPHDQVLGPVTNEEFSCQEQEKMDRLFQNHYSNNQEFVQPISNLISGTAEGELPLRPKKAIAIVRPTRTLAPLDQNAAEEMKKQL